MSLQSEKIKIIIFITINYLISILITFQGNNANNIYDVIDALIENHLVNDVTEECTKNAHTIQNAIPVDKFNDKTDEGNLPSLR